MVNLWVIQVHSLYIGIKPISVSKLKFILKISMCKAYIQAEKYSRYECKYYRAVKTNSVLELHIHNIPNIKTSVTKDNEIFEI